VYQKFIINQDGVLLMGNVYQHRELLQWGDSCPYGGGLWRYDAQRGALLLYGRSFAFGPPCLDRGRDSDWSGAGCGPCPVFFLPFWPDESSMQAVCVQLWG
jgi:hypothetical protein